MRLGENQRMKLINKTKYSREYLFEIIKFCKPANFRMRNIASMTFLMSKKRYGHGNADITVPWQTEIRIGIPRNPYPHPRWVKYTRAKEKRSYLTFENGVKEPVIHSYWHRSNSGYLDYLLLTEEESIVHIIAHEIRHSFQANNPKGRRVWGGRKGQSERDCDAFAINRQRKWRHLHYQDAIQSGKFAEVIQTGNF